MHWYRAFVGISCGIHLIGLVIHVPAPIPTWRVLESLQTITAVHLDRQALNAHPIVLSDALQSFHFLEALPGRTSYFVAASFTSIHVPPGRMEKRMKKPWRMDEKDH